MSKIIIENGFGKKLSLKQLKKEYEEYLSEKTISRNRLIAEEIMISSQINKFIKEKKLNKIKYKNKLYFDIKEVGKCIKKQ